VIGDPVMSSLRQQRDIHIEMAKLGGKYRKRDARLAAISAFFEREITTTKELTEDEADQVIARAQEMFALRGAA
jgi:hypothetical protein